MKRLLLFIFLLLYISCTVYAQTNVVKLRAKTSSFSFYSKEHQVYDDWSDPTSCDILIVVKDHTVDIYSKITQNLSIVSISELQKDEKDVPYFFMSCVDGNGIRCNILLYVLHNDEYTLLLQYSDVIFAYGCIVEN
jgi:hypothetical protein